MKKLFKQLRHPMNKITDKNYDAMRESILADMIKLEGTDEMTIVQDAIFMTASSNRFYSKVYAKLYCCFIEKYPYFNDRINSELNDYISLVPLKRLIRMKIMNCFARSIKKMKDEKLLQNFL